MFVRRKLFLSSFVVLVLVLSLGVSASASNSAVTQVVAVCDFFHEHSGSTSTGGGCYTKAVQKIVPVWKEVDASPDWYCLDCGTRWNVGYGTCGCGYTGSGGNHNYGKKEWKWVDETQTQYELNCGKSNQTKEGTLSLVKTIDANGKYLLSIRLEGNVSMSSCKWDGGAVSVDHNGVYSCDVVVVANGVSKSKTLSYTVTDYDRESPVISSVDKTTKRGRSTVIGVSSTDNVDVVDYMLQKK